MEMRKKKDDDSHNLLNRIERKRKEIESLGTEVRNRGIDPNLTRP